jgi:hypothetical protein
MSIEGVPEGWEVVAIRKPKRGDWVIDSMGTVYRPDCDWCSFAPIIRKIEKPKQYRPFANAEEFKPFRDRWWRCKEGNSVNPPRGYCDTHWGGMKWQLVFDEYEFEDGTPFGIEVSDE